jgi:antitoxin MazE
MYSIKTQIVKIGNSRGIRIPKVLIDQVGLENQVEIAIEGAQLVIRSASRPRAGWEEQFRAMATNRDDRLLDGNVPTKWDEIEWEW